MTEHDRAAAFVDDLVARTRVPTPLQREDLRRELLTYFDDAARLRGTLDEALAAFGAADEVASRLCIVYRAQRVLAHALRITAGLTVSIVVALGLELAVSRPGAFRGMAVLASLIVLVLVLWHELVGRRLRPPSATARAARWLAAFLALAAWEYGIHHYGGISLGVLRAAAISGVLVTVAASTAVIMAGADRAFCTLIQSDQV
ncbi:MAG TPA: hypothetical protein VKE51_33000 [Vicinamibacterales bacterium]|nr:hypothetical protein [Vicinamibacterales bacterium]